ncbi:hypothetical protein KO529_14060 [Arenibacter algicola]|uniref:hypothetical protein n=1 Tax=Arenibacter algicola TaxID=616991 RepID=UPI001C071B59|nr:hypothetical protein [Arenibacter algicola]MBU2905919.1 hypothetical protein [Arenibacter algicola]
MNTERFSNTRIDRVFNNTQSAHDYYDSLIDRGYDKDDITILMSKETKDKYYDSENEDTGSEALKGAGAGSAIGGAAGAIVGAIAAIGTSLVLPGIGLVVAGPLAAAFAGAGVGGAGGAIVGALTKAGLTDSKSAEYVDYLEEGKIIISVDPKSYEDRTYLRNQDGIIYYDDNY